MGKKFPKNGWLDRKGKFYSCSFTAHDSTAIILADSLDLPESLEYLGWVRCYDSGYFTFGANRYEKRLWMRVTKAQERWLMDNGYDMEYLSYI